MSESLKNMHRSVHSISLGTYFPININLRNAETDFFFQLVLYFCTSAIISVGQMWLQTNKHHNRIYSGRNNFTPVMCIHQRPFCVDSCNDYGPCV